MAARLALTAIYEPVEGGWTQARIAEMPAVITAAPTGDEAREYLVDALRQHLLWLGDSAANETSRGGTREPLSLLIEA